MSKILNSGVFVLVVLLGGVFSSVPAEAVLTVQSVTGIAEMTLESQQDWRSVVAGDILEVGSALRTQTGSSVDLLGIDGSLLSIGEETELAINQMDFSEPEQKRIARFTLRVGSLTAEATPLGYPINMFEVETAQVVAGCKFSELTIKTNSQPNETILLPHNGKFEFRQTAGVTQVQCQAGIERHYLSFSMDAPGQIVDMDVELHTHIIALQSDQGVKNMVLVRNNITHSIYIEGEFDVVFTFEESNVKITVNKGIVRLDEKLIPEGQSIILTRERFETPDLSSPGQGPDETQVSPIIP